MQIIKFYSTTLSFYLVMIAVGWQFSSLASETR